MLTECPKCKNKITDSSKYCNHCGAEIKSQVCPNPACGRSNLPLDARFCPDCGTDIEKENPQSAVEQKQSSTFYTTKQSEYQDSTVSFKKIAVIIGLIIIIGIGIGIAFKVREIRLINESHHEYSSEGDSTKVSMPCDSVATP
jgi:predicted amidophosphoribosyltransferase